MKYLLCVLLSFLVLGCVTEEIVYNVKRNEETFRSYTVTSDNENLADVARRFTGSASNWQLLANHNPSIDSYKLKRGDRILIPSSLLADEGIFWLEKEATWQEKKVEDTPHTPEPTLEETPQIPEETDALDTQPTVQPTIQPTPAIVENDITISPYELENRKLLRNEILSDILND